MITTFQVGGLRATELDYEVPMRYGVDQCIGDTLGPGGVFRALHDSGPEADDDAAGGTDENRAGGVRDPGEQPVGQMQASHFQAS